MLTPVAGLAGIILLVWLYHALRRTRSLIRHIRGPPSPSFLVGHERAFILQNEVGDLEFDYLRKYGPTWRIASSFGCDALMTADPKALQHIYQKSGYDYQKRMSQNYVGELMSGPGIVTTTREADHQRHRKIMNPAFGMAQLRSFLPLIQRYSSRLSDIWKSKLTSSNDGEATIQVNVWLSRAALDIIGEAAFNYHYGALDEGGQSSPLSEEYENIFKDVGYKTPFIFDLFRATWDYLPRFVLDSIRFLPFQPFTRIRHLRNLYSEYGMQILHEQRREFDVGKPTDSKDIMSLLIKANCSSDPSTRLSDAELMAEMYTLTVAGHETSATTLTWLTYELARHPEYQDRMREEVLALRQQVEARADSELTMEDLDSELLLTTNAIKETLRMHNIVPGLPRVASKDDVLPLMYPIVSTTGEMISEIPIRAGQVIHTSYAAYHRLKDVWGEDADEWNPDRWLRPETGKQTNVGVFANLMTFSAGPQGCIGWRFSIIEMQTIISELVANFRISLPAQQIVIKRAPTGVIMSPMIVGQEDSIAMPLRISLLQQ